MPGRTGFLTFTLIVVCGFSHQARFFDSCLVAEELQNRSTIEFIVGGYLMSEGGDWKAVDSPLRGPFGIDFDSSGALYIVELSSGRLHQRLPGGEVKTLRGSHEKSFSGDGGAVSRAGFNGPHNCVVTVEDNLLIADSWNHCVRSVDLKTLRTATIAGTGARGFFGDGGPAESARFNDIMCIALSPDGKTLHIADLKNRRVRNLDLQTGKIQTVAGNGTRGVPKDGGNARKSPLVDPRAVASDAAGNLYVLERGGNALRVVRPDGSIHTVAGTGRKGFRDGAALQARFGSPKHICCDAAGNVYIADDSNKAVRKYDPETGQVSTVLGRGFGDRKITLERPHGVRWEDKHLYVVDTGHNRILRILPE